MVLIRKNVCGIGDQCPALNRRPGGGIEVTGDLVDQPDVEATVVVPDSLLPEIAALDVNLGEFITAHHRSDLLRVQTLAEYRNPVEQDDLRRYLAGDEAVGSSAQRAWLARLREDTGRGKIRRNLHVVGEPLTGYLRYLFEWCYKPNSEAGQQIRILSTADNEAAVEIFALGDFALIEHVKAVRIRYGSTGEYAGAAVIGDDAAGSYRALAEMAWALAVPFADWWQAHPTYHRAARAA